MHRCSGERVRTVNANHTCNSTLDRPDCTSMTKTLVMLVQSATGTEVQVTDTINAHFVKVRLNKDGKPTTGYTDRRCLRPAGQ